MTIIGKSAYLNKLKRLSSPEATQRIRKALLKGGETIEAEAERLITTGSVSGKQHVPSKPGDPPNRDTGILDGNIETDFGGRLKVIVSSNAPYAAALELGTSKMEARPYMKPAIAAKRDQVTAYVRQVQKNIVEGR